MPATSTPPGHPRLPGSPGRDGDRPRPLGDEEGGGFDRLSAAIWVVSLTVTIVVAYLFFWPRTTTSLEVSYSAMLEQARAGNVASVTIEGQSLSGSFMREMQLTDDGALVPWDPAADGSPHTERFATTIPDGSETDLVTMLDELGVTVAIEKASGSILPGLLATILPLALIGGFLWLLLRSSGGAGGGARRDVMSFSRSRARVYDPTRPGVTFADIAGEDEAKAELTQVVDFLRHPNKYHDIGARLPRGVLLVGPPGTGKTLLAKAVAGEAGVPFFSVSGSEFVEMFVGVGASRVRDLFERAKKDAPAIVFVDELDAVGRQRFAGIGGGNDEREQTLNQLLVELDGFEQNDEVIVLAATNRPDVLDPALLRPGRFDRQVALGLPDKRGREAILRIHARGKPLAADVELGTIAATTPGFSGADLANLVNEAALTAAGRNSKRVERRDIDEALDKIVLGASRALLMSDREKALLAYHEAGHALVAALTPGADPLRKISIVPRGQALGVTVQSPTEDRFTWTRGYLRGRLATLMGGRAAEQLVFDEATTGAENDLKEATSLARRMVGLWGMSDEVGPFFLGTGEQHVFLGREMTRDGRDLSDDMLGRAEAAAQALLADALAGASDSLRRERATLDRLAAALIAEETIGEERIEAIIHGGAQNVPAQHALRRLVTPREEPVVAVSAVSAVGSRQ